jgi:tetratricopeptide (TPR) repeat protein
VRARVLLAALWLGCSPPPQASSSDLGLVGCDRLDDRDGELDCELALGEEELRLWAPGDKPLVLLDGLVHAPLRAYERGGGWHLTLSVPRAARRLTVARAAADAQPMSFGSVNLRWPEDSTRVEELAPLFAAYQDARDADCHDLAVALFQRAHAERRWRRALLVATLGSACGIRQGDLEAIARWRSEAERVPAGPDGREMDRANLIALAHFHEGNFHAALTAIERGIEHALRFDMTSMHAQLLSLYSLALIETGDFAGAMTAAREALDGEEHPHLDRTSQVALRDNLAWAMIRQAERLGLRAPAEAERELLRALDAVEDPAYTGPLEYGSTLRLNLARLFLLVDRLPAVDQLLDAVAAEADSLGPKFQSP